MFAQLWNGFLLSLPAVQGGVGHRHLPLLVIRFARWVQVEAGEVGTQVGALAGTEAACSPTTP